MAADRPRAPATAEQLVQVGVALERPIALEEVLLYVAHHALGLALGARALRAARLGREAVMVGQLQEASVEDHAVVPVMLEHSSLLIIDQYGARYAAKITEGLYQRLVGMLGILARGRPGMEPPRIAQGINRKIDLAALTSHNGLGLAPVMLELETRRGLEADGLLAGPQRPLGLDIASHHGAATGVALFTDQLEDHFGVPDIIGQQLIDDGFEGIQLACSQLGRPPGGRLLTG